MILFLDFDGVTHKKGADIDRYFECMPHIWSLLRRRDDIRVVLSTSWRENYDFADMIEMCTFGGGEDLESRFVGTTPVIRFNRRDLECKAWIDSRARFDYWIAVDDDPSLFSTHEHLYQIDPHYGFSESDAETLYQRICTYDKYDTGFDL